MDSSTPPKLKKVDIWFAIVVALMVNIIVVFCCFGLILMIGKVLGSGLCGSEVFQEVFSPDEQHKAVVFQRSCGATTNFSTQISILDANQELHNEPGNIFAMDGHPDYTGVQVIWENNRTIYITYASGYKVSNQQETYEGRKQAFKIKYKVNSNK